MEPVAELQSPASWFMIVQADNCTVPPATTLEGITVGFPDETIRSGRGEISKGSLVAGP